MLFSDSFSRLFATVAVAIAMTGSLGASENDCKLRAGYFNLPLGQDFVGMFEIKLRLPDFGDLIASQRHAGYVMIWGHALADDLNRTTGGRCTAFFTPYPFPNLRTFLMGDKNYKDAKSACQRALDSILQNRQADDIKTQRAISMMLLGTEPARPSDKTISSAILDATNILNATLKQIYAPNSILHALVSIPWRELRSITPAKHQNWVQDQVAGQRLHSDLIPPCLPSPQQRGWVPDPAAISLAELSEVLPRGEIKLRREDGPIPAGPLRYAIIVSDLSRLEITGGAFDLRCDQNNSFSFADSSGARQTVRLRCISTTVFDLDSWTIVFCDPDDCASQQKENATITAFANELGVSKALSGSLRARGPYMVTINGDFR